MNDSAGWGGYMFANAKVGATGWSTILGTYRPTITVNFASTVKMAPRTGSSQYFYIDEFANLRMSASTANIGSSSGTVVGTQTSDERLKNIEPDFEYGLEQVMQLQPIAYTFKNDEDETRCLGFGAQTTQDIVPEAVYDTNECVDGYDVDPEDEENLTPRSEDTKFAMKYVELIPVLTKAIQELKSEIDSLKSQLNPDNSSSTQEPAVEEASEEPVAEEAPVEEPQAESDPEIITKEGDLNNSSSTQEEEL